MTSRIGLGGVQTSVPAIRLGPGVVALMLLGFEALALAGTSLLAGGLYHALAYDWPAPHSLHLGIGLLAGLVFALPALYRGDYQIQRLLDASQVGRGAVQDWIHAFLCLLVIGFLTKTSALFSRGVMAIFFVTGLLCVVAVRKMLPRLVQYGIHVGYVASRRVMLVGAARDVDDAADRLAHYGRGLVVCAAFPIELTGQSGRDPELTGSIVDRVRAMRPDDIVILAPLAEHRVVELLAGAFLALPASVHVTTREAFAQFHNARFSRVGGEATICLSAQPIGPVQAVIKRLFDLIAAVMALVLLGPVMMAVAVMIRLETPGPALYLQKRRGFNQEEFRIWKFRTMTTLDDGERPLQQAFAGDARITRVGAFLRRYNLDELPQLINVVKGEMSIVGPRPHAVSHDQHYGGRISAYPRRLNVKPGLTGWAQIHGFRGPTPNESDMARRIEHDLYYIENWSILLDIYIIAMTVVSPKAYKNAL